MLHRDKLIDMGALSRDIRFTTLVHEPENGSNY